MPSDPVVDFLNRLRAHAPEAPFHFVLAPEPDADGHVAYDLVANNFSTAEVTRDKLNHIIGMARRAQKAVYYGPVPRTSGGRLLDGVVCWVDMDVYKLPDNGAAAWAGMKQLGIQPTYVIGSGRGYHLIFVLDAPVPSILITDMNQRLRHAVEHRYRLMSGPVLDVVDAASRCLRLPGSLNHKARAACSILEQNGPTWAFDKLDKLVPELPSAPMTMPAELLARPSEHGVALLGDREAPPCIKANRHLHDLWKGLSKFRGDLSPSGYDSTLAIAMLKQGFSADKVVEVIRQRREGDQKSATYAVTTVQRASQVLADGIVRAPSLRAAGLGGSVGGCPPHGPVKGGRGGAS